jgi:hypothetical protein
MAGLRNLLGGFNVKDMGYSRSHLLIYLNYDVEIDETKREKYVFDANRWFRLIPYNEENNIINVLGSFTSNDAYIMNAPYYMQVRALNLFSDRNYPLSCHFVKRPFAHQFKEFYFFNSKAEEFKWWTAKFLDHGLFVFWKRLHGHMFTLYQRRESLQIRLKTSSSSSNKDLDISNFIGQVHLIVFYIVISALTTICVGIFVLECAMQKAREILLFVLAKFKHFSLQLLWTIVRFLSLMKLNET